MDKYPSPMNRDPEMDSGCQEMPKHISIARQMAHEVMKNENHEMQNEMMREMRQIVIENRRKLIDQAAEQVEYLKKTLGDI